MDHALTVSDMIDQRPLTRLQISTFLLCGLVLVLDRFDARSLGFLAPSKAKTFRVPVSSFGPIWVPRCWD
jgi:AAHS family 4-hydroxybenzoate transporter-like MFS transporter